MPLGLATWGRRFVGRDGELAAAANMLRTGPLLTLWGPGGAGKTRLAAEIARRALRVCFVELEGVGDRDGLAAATMLAAGLREETGPDLRAVGERLNTLGEALMVLDNAEHVLPQVREALALWLSAAPALRFLVTTRERLGLAEERALQVGPLAPPDGVELFAGALPHGCTIAPGDAQTVRRIVEELDGMPLALELAAGRFDLLSATELLTRLRARLEVLRDPIPGRPDRHRSLAACLGLSWDALDGDEQRLLTACAVFRGGLDARAVSGLGEPAAGLGRLADVSMLWRDPEVPDRYDMLTSVRRFVDSVAPPTDELRARHLEWLAEQTRDLPGQGPDLPRTLAFFRREQANLRAAAAFAATRPAHRDEAAHIVHTLAVGLAASGSLTAARLAAQAYLDGLGAPSTRSQLRLLTVLAHIERQTGRQADAMRHLILAEQGGNRLKAHDIAARATPSGPTPWPGRRQPGWPRSSRPRSSP